MLKLYSEKKTEKILREYSPWIETLAERYGIPAACMKAVLRKEIAEIDLFDPLADLLVWFHWLRCDLRRRLYRLGLVKREEPRLRRGIFGKKDSSTGYGQIFAFVAINAANYALDRGLEGEEALGLTPGERPSPDSLRDRERMWRRLLRDKKYNIRMSTLNLISAGEEMNGHTDFDRYTAEEFRHMFTRYNANSRAITPYGEEVYRYFRQYSDNNNIM